MNRGIISNVQIATLVAHLLLVFFLDYRLLDMRPEKRNDGFDAYARYLWPGRLDPGGYFGTASDGYERLFNSPFTKRGAKYTGRGRGHLRFVRRKLCQFV